MLVYHASDCRFTSPDVLHSRAALDFGKGFYVTRLLEQAEKYAFRFIREGKPAFIHSFELLSPDSDMKIKIFNTYDEEWLDFVCNCRNGKDDYKQYDIIEGGVANDKVFQTLDLYMAGIYDKEQALRKLVYEMPNNQLCFTSQRAIDRCLRFVQHN
ncbi:MAG: DUF3990 domain-containing protein, partial [Muribaculaceae bacterium]|nr:DUF3990 domain-containing protein [Muribaculaceae bacterium]